MGAGQQASDFVFVEDVVDALMLAPTANAIGKIIEIGTSNSTSVLEVARTTIKLSGSRSEIKFTPMRTGEKKITTFSDCSDAKKYLGRAPRLRLRRV